MQTSTGLFQNHTSSCSGIIGKAKQCNAIVHFFFFFFSHQIKIKTDFVQNMFCFFLFFLFFCFLKNCVAHDFINNQKNGAKTKKNVSSWSNQPTSVALKIVNHCLFRLLAIRWIFRRIFPFVCCHGECFSVRQCRILQFDFWKSFFHENVVWGWFSLDKCFRCHVCFISIANIKILDF